MVAFSDGPGLLQGSSYSLGDVASILSDAFDTDSLHTHVLVQALGGSEGFGLNVKRIITLFALLDRYELLRQCQGDEDLDATPTFDATEGSA